MLQVTTSQTDPMDWVREITVVRTEQTAYGTWLAMAPTVPIAGAGATERDALLKLAELEALLQKLSKLREEETARRLRPVRGVS